VIDLLAFHAVIVAGGRGERAALGLPKQYALMGGQPLLRWSAAAFAAHPACASLTIVVPAGDEARCAEALVGIDHRCVAGGATRQASVHAGLQALTADDDAIVLIHDAARPGLTAAVIDRLLIALDDAAVAGAIPVLAVADTLAQDAGGGVLGGVVPRDGLMRVQTPQAARLGLIRHAHAAWAGAAASDDAQMLRAMGGRVQSVPGAPSLEKITLAEDLAMMERMLAPPAPCPAAAATRMAVGSGYDVHRLVPGDGLWLGGVHIAHDRALLGHSDADVALHALTDALLGALGDGDIGSHFPPSDPQWRGAASEAFLAHAQGLALVAGGRIEHVDCTIICEAPKVGPHRERIRANVARILAVPLARVSIKATTTEKLGFTGRQEGIAAQATVTLRLPDSGDDA